VTADAAAVQAAVRNGDATAGLADGTLYVQPNGTGTFPLLVAQAVVAQEAASRLAAAGLMPAQVTDLQSIQPPKQVIVGPVEDQGRAAFGFVLAIVLFLALTFAGNAIATTVGTETATRISEVLLAVLRPSQILTGNVLAVGRVTLLQLLVLAAPFAVSLSPSVTRRRSLRWRRLGLPGSCSGSCSTRSSSRRPRPLSTRSPR
jgi:ABC-2 type transport system permease protein